METIILNIDGYEIEAKKGKTVLEAALEAGIYIPNLCHHPNLKPVGVCRLCVVEIEGVEGIVTSCTTPADVGMVVKTKSPELDILRRLSMELMLAGHPSECTGCPTYGKCEFQSLIQLLGVSSGRLRRKHKSYPVNISNPLFVHDISRCILCGRCVRACQELRGVQVLNYQQKEGETYIGTAADHSLADSNCKFCGACVEVCPTGTLRDKEGLIKEGIIRKAALVPCSTTCPAGIDIPRYIRLIREGKPSEAAAVIREKVPFPMSLGYICNHLCESSCRREAVNEPIAIRDLKRYAAENDDKQWKKYSRILPVTGQRIAVIGAGPTGLTAAYYLSKQGHKVTIFEALPFAGGMLRYGIPEYRLPSGVVAEEIKEIESVGVEIKTNTRVDSLDKLFEEGYSAVLVAIGTQQGVKLPIPGNELDGVWVNISFLREARLGNTPKVGKRVVVLGGGNVAVDCARVARRLGAEEVHLACLEARDKMPASSEELQQAEEEGITLHPLQTFVEITGEQGRVTGVECLDVESCEFDEEKRAQINVCEGSEHRLPADTVIFSVGQRPEKVDQFGLDLGRGSTIQVDQASLLTSRVGVFAAGDAVTGTVSVIESIAAGRKAASAIDKYLGGDGIIDETLAPLAEPSAWLGKEEGFAYKNRCKLLCKPADQRVGNFDEVEHGYDKETALKESERCLQCDLRTKITKPRFWGDYSSKPTSINIAETLTNPTSQGYNVHRQEHELCINRAESQCNVASIIQKETCIIDSVRKHLSLIQAESCGKCVLCREGTYQMVTILTDITQGKGKSEDIALLLEIAGGMQTGSTCSLSMRAADSVLTTIKHFREEFEEHIKRKKCKALVCKKYISYHILGNKCQGCGNCLKNCPVSAIAGGEGLIHVIDQEECTKCGSCLAVCPVEYAAVTKAGPVKPRTPEEPVPVGSWKKK